MQLHAPLACQTSPPPLRALACAGLGPGPASSFTQRSALCFARPAGAASLWLAVFERPHWLALGAIQAAAGACWLCYILSFFAAFGPLSLLITLSFGSVLGVLCWDSAWRIVWRFLPAMVQPYAETWARDGLVAGELL